MAIKKLDFFLFLLIILSLILFYAVNLRMKKIRLSKIEVVLNMAEEKQKQERIGEKITYDVRLGSVRIGKAVFNHLAKTELNGKSVRLMTFQTNVARFNDLEKIYSDLDSFLPLRVERSISTWPTPEVITEDYDQSNFTLTIKKIKGKKEEQRIIRKDSPIHNAILLPFYVRRAPDLKIGWTLDAKLPTQEFKVELVSIEDIKVPAGIFRAYYFVSDPKRFEIWVSTDERRIPIKIKGSTGAGYTLLMKEYRL